MAVSPDALLNDYHGQTCLGQPRQWVIPQVKELGCNDNLSSRMLTALGQQPHLPIAGLRISVTSHPYHFREEANIFPGTQSDLMRSGLVRTVVMIAIFWQPQIF